MKANELRVNNWIERKFWNPHPNNPSFMWDKCTVDAIYAGRVNCRLDKSTVIKLQYEDIRPIPLSPELLEKCGFVYQDNKSWQLDIDYGVSIWGRDGKLNVYSEFGFELGVDIEYLHHLQNIIHALTGNELEVKM